MKRFSNFTVQETSTPYFSKDLELVLNAPIQKLNTELKQKLLGLIHNIDLWDDKWMANPQPEDFVDQMQGYFRTAAFSIENQALFKELAQAVIESIEFKDLNEANKGKEYDEFFKKKLKEWEVDSLEELSQKAKKYFFEEIEKEWN